MAVTSHCPLLPYEAKIASHRRLLSHVNHVTEITKLPPESSIYESCQNNFDPSDISDGCLALTNSIKNENLAKKAGLDAVLLNDIIAQPQVFGLPQFHYKPVSHIIFDMDGLLLDTGDIYSAVSKELLAEFGKTPDERLRMQIMGMRQADISERVVNHYNLPMTGEEYAKTFINRVLDFLPNCKPLEGVERLINHFHKQGIPMAVATSSSQESFNKKITNHKELFDKFNHIVTGSDPELKSGKPAPDIFQICASRFDSKPSFDECLVFEDAPNGVEAAKAAGMQSVMIPDKDKVFPEYTLKATQLITDMNFFEPKDFGLPEFEE